MAEALLFGLVGSSALVAGGVLGAYWTAPKRVTGVLLAFASGTLLSALAFELFPEAVELDGVGTAAAGLFVGAGVFVVLNTWLDAATLQGSGDPEAVPGAETLPDEIAEGLAPATLDERRKIVEQASEGPGSAVGLALLAAVVLDGVPENLALGVSLVDDDGGSSSVALLVAVFASNFPESLVGSAAMRTGGRTPQFAISTWTSAFVLLTIAVIGGRALASGLDDGVLAFAQAFAGGAVLASLADTLMPEAFEHGQPFNALATAVGFLMSFVLAS